MLPLSEREKDELVTGVLCGFEDVQFIGRFIDVFIGGVRLSATHPADLVMDILADSFGQETGAPMDRRVFAQARLRSRVRREVDRRLRQNKVRGQTIANIAAVCVETHLQSGRHFSKGQGTNDLMRMADHSRWEVKGSRSKDLQLTINQSHRHLEETTFLVYCGFPERNELHGIYVIEGQEEAFSPRKPGLNMRTLLPQFKGRAVQLYPEL